MTSAVGADTARYAVIGEALVDIVDDGGSPYLAHAGGSPLNVAVGLARLGAATTFLGRFSTDAFGTLLREHVTRSGADLSHAVTTTAPSTLALVTLRNGAAHYRFTVEGTADFGWTDSELAELPDGVGVVHTGSLASWLPPGDAAIRRRLATLRQQGRVLVSYDPNVRPQLQPDPAAARERVEAYLPLAHLVKVSEEDWTWLYGDEPADAVAARWLAAGATLVVLTRGADGAVAYRSGAAPLARPVVPAPVVDTVGAGDSFMSGMLDALGRHGALAPAALAAAAADDGVLDALLAEATLTSSITCSRAGADPPWASEVSGRL